MLFIRDVKGIWLGEGLIKELVGEGWKSKTSTKFFSCVNWGFFIIIVITFFCLLRKYLRKVNKSEERERELEKRVSGAQNLVLFGELNETSGMCHFFDGRFYCRC